MQLSEWEGLLYAADLKYILRDEIPHFAHCTVVCTKGKQPVVGGNTECVPHSFRPPHWCSCYATPWDS